MDMSKPPVGPPSVSPPSSSNAPTAATPTPSPPTQSPVSNLTVSPTSTPTTSAPSLSPSANPTPTVFQEETIFECTDDGVNLAKPPFEAATVVTFQVGYLVESAFALADYETDLEEEILASALEGALQCTSGGPLFGTNSSGLGTNSSAVILPMNTSLTTGICFPTISFQNDCVVLETTFRVVLAEEIDPEVASFLAYVELQKDMEGQVFEQALSEVDRIEYLSPLPLLPPISGPEESNPPANEVGEDPLSVTPWTFSAVLAMCTYNLFVASCV